MKFCALNMTRSIISLLSCLLFLTIALNPCSSQELNGIFATRDQLANISLILYTGTTTAEFKRVLIANAVILLPEIDPRKPTLLYFHGYNENQYSTSVRTIIQAYLQRQDHNVIQAEYGEIVAGSYVTAALSANSIGYTIAQGINRLVAAGLNPSTLHMVGHSLGSQISGFVARNLNFRVPRITGLDPAGPGFYILILNVNSNDAEFVDIIHTDAGVFGTAESIGTVDFYPNGGFRTQPGCPPGQLTLGTGQTNCDHARSWQYYAESLRIERAFVGLKCIFYLAFQLGLCRSNERVVMGYGTPPTAKGKVYLQTNSRSPFGRGENGVY